MPFNTTDSYLSVGLDGYKDRLEKVLLCGFSFCDGDNWCFEFFFITATCLILLKRVFLSVLCMKRHQNWKYPVSFWLKTSEQHHSVLYPMHVALESQQQQLLKSPQEADFQSVSIPIDSKAKISNMFTAWYKNGLRLQLIVLLWVTTVRGVHVDIIHQLILKLES